MKYFEVKKVIGDVKEKTYLNGFTLNKFSKCKF